MLTKTPNLLKFRKLQRRLHLPKYAVAGLLELLWIATAKNAPAGDIGKFDNESIATELDWHEDPDELITALIDTGWLDVLDGCRLFVHDWSTHAPWWVHGNLAKAKKHFADGSSPSRDRSREASRDRSREASLEGTFNDTRLFPTIPYPSIPFHPKADGSTEASREETPTSANGTFRPADFFIFCFLDGKTYELSEDVIQRYREDFPLMDVHCELSALAGHAKKRTVDDPAVWLRNTLQKKYREKNYKPRDTAAVPPSAKRTKQEAFEFKRTEIFNAARDAGKTQDEIDQLVKQLAEKMGIDE